MQPTTADTSIANDVLHNPEHSRLSPEEIAKAVAHHKRHHSSEREAQQSAKPPQGKKQPGARSK